MTPEEYRQLKAYTRQDGLVMGLLWTAAFACFAFIFSYPSLAFLFDLLLLCVPFSLWHMVRRYRDRVIAAPLSFGRAFIYALSVCMYATIILCLCQWIYFQYIDHGAFFGNIEELLSASEYKSMISAYGISQNEVNEVINAMRVARPIDIAISSVSQSFMGSLICSAIIALITRNKK